MKKNIIISSYDSLKNPYYCGGGATAINEIAMRLSRDFDVTVLVGKYSHCKNYSISPSLRYVYTGVSFGGGKIGQLFFLLSLPIMASRLKYDLWIDSFTPPFSVSPLPFFVRKPLIGLVHMLSGDDMQRKYKLPFKIVENYCLKFYKHIISVSKYNANKISGALVNTDIIVIPNGVNNPITTSEVSTGQKYISFIGRIEINQKGLDLLLEAFNKVSEYIPYRLQIAGSGSKKEFVKLNSLISKYSLTDKVLIRGRVDGNIKSKFFQESLAVVIPSRFETAPLVAAEAFAVGLPIVCFDIDGLKHVPTTCSLKAKPFNTSELAGNLFTISKNTNLRNKLAKFSQIESAKYSWDNSAIFYKKYINSILNKN